MQGFTGDDDSVVSSLLGQALITKRFNNLNSDSLGLKLLQNEHVHGVVKQLARMTDVNCSLDLVAREHPKLHSSLFDIIDCFANFVLKLILDSC